MGLSVGIVGLPNAGPSTTLTCSHATRVHAEQERVYGAAQLVLP